MSIETLLEREILGYRLTIETEYDSDPDLSYLGKYCNFNPSPESWLYHRHSGLMFDGSTWRNEKGQIQAEPYFESRSREYQFIEIGTWQFERSDKHSLRYAYQNAKNLEDINNGHSAVIGVIAKVERKCEFGSWHEVGRGSCWGIETDWGKESEAHVNMIGKECLAEALAQAKAA